MKKIIFKSKILFGGIFGPQGCCPHCGWCGHAPYGRCGNCGSEIKTN